MCKKFMFAFVLNFISVYSAPMKLQFMPLQYGMQQQNQLQLLNPFLKQGLPYLQSPLMYSQQPIVFLMPNMAPAAEAADRFINLNEETATGLKSNTGHIDETNDAVILDAEPNSKDEDITKTVTMANGARFSIGNIISYIPFLPIEINVPDTISWIAGLFPGNWFGRPGQKPETTKRLSNKGPMPILVIPTPMMQ